MAIKDYGHVNFWEIGIDNGAQDTVDFLDTYIIPYLKVAKYCGNSDSSDCTYDIHTLDNQVFVIGNTSDYVRFYLANGTAITSFSSGSNSKNSKKREVQFYIDTNGWKKPNKLGVDVHLFLFNTRIGEMRPQHVKPYIMPPKSNDNNPSSYIRGFSDGQGGFRGGCVTSGTAMAGVYCTSLILYGNGGKIPSKEKYVELGGEASLYPW